MIKPKALPHSKYSLEWRTKPESLVIGFKLIAKMERVKKWPTGRRSTSRRTTTRFCKQLGADSV